LVITVIDPIRRLLIRSRMAEEFNLSIIVS
jgi:hypothetical protein